MMMTTGPTGRFPPRGWVAGKLDVRRTDSRGWRDGVGHTALIEPWEGAFHHMIARDVSVASAFCGENGALFKEPHGFWGDPPRTGTS
ncbi:hypothetical protein CRUP_031360 [Coryphaenoides rupestris]|nr:hypothetical protein CRUP_031360 [Coryphaenoides rupestris]